MNGASRRSVRRPSGREKGAEAQALPPPEPILERLHPCPACGHSTMDECWAAGKELPDRSRKLCLDCHDECRPKVRRRPSPAGENRTASSRPEDVPRLLFAPRGSARAGA